MALHAALMINGADLGEGIVITRLNPVDPGVDTTCTYRVEVYRHRLPTAWFNIEHRYGDGAMLLMARALDRWAERYEREHDLHGLYTEDDLL